MEQQYQRMALRPYQDLVTLMVLWMLYRRRVPRAWLTISVVNYQDELDDINLLRASTGEDPLTRFLWWLLRGYLSDIEKLAAISPVVTGRVAR